jgi:recombinational DNA repair protein RecR
MNGTATIPSPQHMRALARANEVRLARAELKRRIAGGQLAVAEVITACPPEAEGMTVAELLTSQRRWGHNRARRLVAEVPVSETKTLGSMTERQRRALERLLPRA